MAKITDTQAQEMIDNFTIYILKTGETFDCYHFDAQLDGYYYKAAEADPAKLSPTADKATVEAYFKTLLKALDYQGVLPTKTDTPV